MYVSQRHILDCFWDREFCGGRQGIISINDNPELWRHWSEQSLNISWLNWLYICLGLNTNVRLNWFENWTLIRSLITLQTDYLFSLKMYRLALSSSGYSFKIFVKAIVPIRSACHTGNYPLVGFCTLWWISRSGTILIGAAGALMGDFRDMFIDSTCHFWSGNCSTNSTWISALGDFTVIQWNRGLKQWCWFNCRLYL